MPSDDGNSPILDSSGQPQVSKPIITDPLPVTYQALLSNTAPTEYAWMMPAMAFGTMFLLGLALVLTWLSKETAVFTTMVGAIAVIAKDPISFYFGSSKGSQDKDRILSNDSQSKTAAIINNASKGN